MIVVRMTHWRSIGDLVQRAWDHIDHRWEAPRIAAPPAVNFNCGVETSSDSGYTEIC